MKRRDFLKLTGNAIILPVILPLDSRAKTDALFAKPCKRCGHCCSLVDSKFWKTGGRGPIHNRKPGDGKGPRGGRMTGDGKGCEKLKIENGLATCTYRDKRPEDCKGYKPGGNLCPESQ